MPERTLERDRRPDRRRRPRWSCWSTATARRRGGDRRGRAAGQRPRQARRHAHVRQGRLPAGDRARPTAARSTSPPASTSRPTGATSAARGIKRRAPASRPTSAPRTTRRPQPRRGARHGAAHGRRPSAVSRRAGARRQRRRSGCWPSAGASSSPSRSSSAAAGSSSTARPRRAARAARAACARRAAAARPARKVVAVLGRPDVARDVIEALMLDRGLRRSFPAGVERAAPRRVERAPADARRRAATCATCRRSRSTRSTRPGLRRRDQRRGADGERAWRIWVHIADVSAYVRAGLGASTARPTAARPSVYVPGAVEPMLPEALSNGACSLVPGPGSPRRDRRARAATARDGARAAAFYRSLIRSDERLDYDAGRPHLRRRASAPRTPWARAAGRRARGGAALRARREPRAARWRSSPPSRSSASTAAATSPSAAGASRPSRTG